MSSKRWGVTVTLDSGVMFSRQLGIKDLREAYVTKKNEGPTVGLKPLEHWVYEVAVKDVVENLKMDIGSIKHIKIEAIGFMLGGLRNAYYT